MIRIFVAVTLLLFSISTLSAQDVLVDRKGNELPCKLISADKKYFVYKGYQDPEFTSQKTQISKYRKIRYADGREIKISPPATGWIFFGAGPAIPLGSYASSNVNNAYAGFAKTNVGFQTEVAIPAFGKNKRWSILAIISGFSNETDNMGKYQWYQTQSSYSVLGGGLNNSKHSDQWKMNSLIIGTAYTIPLSWKFSFDQKAGIGPGMASKFNEHYTFNISGQPAGVYYNYYSYGEGKDNGDTLRAKSLTLVLHYGAAFRYFISRTVALRIGADFQYAAPTFNIHQRITPDPPSGQAFDPNKTETVHSRIFVARIQFGVCINLMPKKNKDYGITQ